MPRPEDDSASSGEDQPAASPLFDWIPRGSLRYPIRVFAGIVLLVGAVGLAYASGSTPYEHNAWECDGDPYEEDSPYRYRYDELSPSTQEIVRQAIEGESPVQTGQPAPEFEYSKSITIYNIEYQNTCYYLEVSEQRNAGTLMVAFLIGAVGVVVAAHGSGRFG